ncbi:MAG: SMI1/KNR4 family protein [Actinobacteria bacterium]|nr:SMI1/KNR4 family protein [Actinomycetota bacterium]MBW3647031.1 SMI1/KNR4 family protein [Actinomycetota bacterium]
MNGVTDDDLDATEQRLGVVFPSDYRALMRSQDGFTEDGAGATLMVNPLKTLVETNEEVAQHVPELRPGANFFGSDGSRESLVWDLRQTEPPVYLVDITNAGWHEALLQASNLTAFVEQFRAEGGFRWS